VLPLAPLLAAILKVHLSRMEVSTGVNLVSTDVHFHRARSNREQGSTITRSFAPPQESQIEKTTPEGLARDGGGATSDPTANQNEDNPFPPDAFDPRSPLLGNDRRKFGADPSDWAVRFLLGSVCSPSLLIRFGGFDRWRLILLSPEEEDQIAAQLAGQGWYQAVTEILTSQADGGEMPTPIPVTDWRYQWVQSTLRRLESIIPTLQDEAKHNPSWLETDPDDVQLPPPAEYPLRPRPRASEYLKMFSDMTCGKMPKHTPDHAPHSIAGPPYSLLLVDNPDASNAFSYGFGPDGGAGIVLYTAFIDEVLSDPSLSPSTMSRNQSEETSWWSYLFGSILSTSHHQHPVPSPDQTNRLAVLLAHELSHLILSHHLESLTSSSIVLPGLLSILTDLVRTLMFPVTMLFGPFVNDAVANMGKIGSGEVTKLSVLCTNRVQELEADVVSTRILAYAGFDPHSTIGFWESRTPTVYGDVSECATWREDSNDARNAEGGNLSHKSALSLFGSTHPLNDTRVGALTKELLRWSAVKEEALAHLQAENQPGAQ